MDFNTLLHEKAELINHTLAQLLASQQIDSKLKESLKYTLGTPGKRVRSALVLWCCELAGGQVNRNAEIAAAAIEMVHTYSLVHDDLPAMDDDDLRRGLPTCHKAFDEATAILTGDALLTLAFEILAKEIDEPTIAVKLIAQLAQDAGPSGMIAGQMADIKTSMLDTGCSSSIQNRVSRIEYIHTNKTAKMFRCAAAMGAICGGASKQQIDQLSEYGLKIGLGFQIADDILDVSASSEQLGKTAGKDAKAAKCTYPAVVGIDKARELEKKLADEAVAVLRPLGKKADTLRQLAMAMLERTK
ncbi:MAG: polyprenyl synthetase family protein [Planctomycetes bacterium]|nr:polyprenyl synthetase family protein [Planctomycetota bacterium]